MEISEIRTAAPAEGRAAVELETFALLDRLHIPYAWVAHETADTIADCDVVSEVLGISICKNLFLCNRQQTDFYLLMMTGDKPFKTKDLSPLLGCSRLSFAGPEHMERLLRTIPGSVSALELMFDTQALVRLVIDRDLLKDRYLSGHPGISTSTLCLEREEMIRFVEATGHTPTYLDLPDPRLSEQGGGLVTKS